MKTRLQIIVVCLLLTCSFRQVQAQTLIQFWDFNQIRPDSGGGGDSLGTVFSYANSATTDSVNRTWPLTPAYSKVAGAKIVFYRPRFKYAPVGNNHGYDSILDGVGTGGAFIYDYSSSHYSYFTKPDSTFPEVNAYLKVRNPSDSNYMYIYAPTTGYMGISMQFAITQSSSKGAIYNVFSYSTDGGTTWNKLTKAMDTFNIGGKSYPDTLQASNPTTVASLWYPVQINFTSDASVNNNPNFILRIRFAGPNTTGGSGNDRYDNFAFWASSVAGVNELTAGDAGYSIYPNPADDQLTLTSTYKGDKLVTVHNILGQTLSTVKMQNQKTVLDISSLASGTYFINIKELESGNFYTVKFVKN